jgi:hypothetical protein
MPFIKRLSISFLVCVSLVAGCEHLSFAQLVQQLPPARFGELASTKLSSTPTPKPTGRFLGWKYAALAHQDTRRWFRPNPSVKSPAAQSDASSKREGKPFSAQAHAETSTTYAGFATSAKLPTGYLPTAVREIGGHDTYSRQF